MANSQVVEKNNGLTDGEVLPPDVKDRIQEAKRQNNALMTMMDELMQEGIDYGTVKGVSKPFLHQPGAQQLGLVFKFRPEFEKVDSIIDFDQDPVFVSYEYKCKLYHKESGAFLGEGVGSCNNYERKYKYYKDKRVFEDPLDRQNTIVKMAKKRAYVDATLNVTGASRLFTQDQDLVEHDLETGEDGTPENPGEFRMPFGKSKGTKLKNLDDGYLKWIAEKMEPRNEEGEKVQEIVKEYLNQENARSQNKDKSKNKSKNKSSNKGNQQQENNKGQKESRIEKLNDLIAGNNGLWDVVKEYLEQETGENEISKVKELSDKQFKTIRDTIENMIPPEGEELEEDEIEVPF